MLFRFANEKDSDIIMQGLIEIEYYEKNNSSFFSDKDGTNQRKRIHDAITNNSIMIVEDGLYKEDDSSDDSDSDSKSDSSVSTDSGINMNILKRQVVAGFIWFTMTKKCFVGIDNCDFTDSYVYISYVWVNKLIRGKGIAKKLYAKVIEYCKANNVKKVWLDIPLNNKSSMDFHKKIGFEAQTTLYSKCL
jgi:ribosomal protein S18 acetylase RimI-like enzyme